MRFLNFTTAAIALACVTSVSAFAQTKPMASPSAGPASKMGKMSKMTPSGKTAKKMPMRDPKTGKFMSSDKSKMAKMSAMSKSTKKTPMRDPKTGRFMSSKPKTASPAPK